MTDARPSLFARDDTFFGVCEALGQDFGFDPLWLRIAFAVAVLWNPVTVIAAYLALGAVVAAARWAFPSRAARAPVAVAPPVPLVGENDAAVPDFAAAA